MATRSRPSIRDDVAVLGDPEARHHRRDGRWAGLSRHQRGIIHRDIKPANLMMSRGGLVKVLDFGIARLSAPRIRRDRRARRLIGTPAYMAPEQLEGADVDARSDIYAVGLVMYELLLGPARLCRGDDGRRAAEGAGLAARRRSSAWCPTSIPTSRRSSPGRWRGSRPTAIRICRPCARTWRARAVAPCRPAATTRRSSSDCRPPGRWHREAPDVG